MRAHHIKTLSFSDLHKRMVLVTLKQQSYSMCNKVRRGRVKSDEPELYELQNLLSGDNSNMLDLYNLLVYTKRDFLDLSLPWGEDDNTRAVPVGVYPVVSSNLVKHRGDLFNKAQQTIEALDPSLHATLEQMSHLAWYAHPLPDTFDPLDSEDIDILSDTYHEFQVIAMEAVWKRLKDKFDLVDRVVIEGLVENKSVNFKQSSLVNLKEAIIHASMSNFLMDVDLERTLSLINLVFEDVERFSDVRRFEDLKERVILGSAEIRACLIDGIKKYQ